VKKGQRDNSSGKESMAVLKWEGAREGLRERLRDGTAGLCMKFRVVRAYSIVLYHDFSHSFSPPRVEAEAEAIPS